MSFYSGGEVRTKIIDPVNDITNTRSEFRLDDLGAVMSNMKLINIGCKSSAGSKEYSDITGTYGIIKNISLKDGNTELSSCRDANFWLGWKNLNMSNSENESLNKFVSKSNLGFFSDSESGKQGESRIAEGIVSDTEKDDEKGHLELRMILPLLLSLRSLDNLRFKRLRLVVEYDKDIKDFMNTDNVPVSTYRPSLVVDVIEDEGVRNSELQNSPSSVNWIEIEKDSFIVPAVPVSAGTIRATQNTTHKVNAFNNKTLSRVLLQKTNSDKTKNFSANTRIGSLGSGSIGQYLQKTQYRVNGSNLLSGAGVEGSNQRMALLVDTWGDINQSLGGNILGGHTGGFTDEGANRKGNFDYDGIFVGKAVKDFQILLERVGVYNNGVQAQDINQLTVNVYGEVNKNIQMKGDEYLISYN